MWSYEKFKEYIDSKQITENSIVRKTGIYQTIFQRWKKGDCEPKYKNMKIICDYIGLPIEQVMEQ